MKKNLLGAIVAFALTQSGCGSADDPTTILRVSQVRIVKVEPAFESEEHVIISNFKPDQVAASYEAKLMGVRFNRNITTEDVVAGMKARNLRPANINECIAYMEDFDKKRADLGQKPHRSWTVCLGSFYEFEGVRSVPVFRYQREDRPRFPSWRAVDEWFSDELFIAVEL